MCPVIEKENILFVVSHANVRSEYMPFYFLYLAGYLEKEGFSCSIFNEPVNDECEYSDAVIKYIRKAAPRFVGLAAFVTDYEQILTLAERVKRETNIPVIVGNAHPSICPEDFIYPSSPFDIAVLGEGEISLKEILVGTPLAEIQGIAYLKDGCIKITGKREVMDLADCGMPAYHKISMKQYAKPTKYIIRRIPASVAVIYTGRGCPFKCVFCAANTVWQANKFTNHPLVRKRPLIDVIEELTLLEKTFGFDFFCILDDTFGITAEEVIDFCRAYKSSGLTMLWIAETRVNGAIFRDELLLQMMKDAGCIQIDLGVETGSSRLLKVIQKGITPEQIINAFDMCRRNGIRTVANVLINLPTETTEDIRMTEELLDRIKPTFVSLGVTQPYPGTVCFEQYLKIPVDRSKYKDLNRVCPNDSYRMAAHSLPLQKLLLRLQFRYHVYAPFEISIFHTDRCYWNKIMRSSKKLQYAWAFVRQLGVDSFAEYVWMRICTWRL